LQACRPNCTSLDHWLCVQFHATALVIYCPNTPAMPTVSAPTHSAKPSTPKRYVGIPLRFVMLQSEVPPHKRLPLIGSSLHMRRTHRKTCAVSFHDALHAAVGGSRSSLERLPCTSEEVLPSRNTRKSCSPDEKRTPSVTHMMMPEESLEDNSRETPHEHHPLVGTPKEKDQAISALSLL
jgi:hypothetical protein